MSYKFLPQIIYCISYTFVPHVVQCYTTDAGIQNFLKDLEDKLVEHFCHVKRMDRTGAPRTALELTSKDGCPMRRTRTRWFSQAKEKIKMRWKR
jgi:hypothetical protein